VKYISRTTLPFLPSQFCAGLAFTGGETGTTEWKPGETIRLKIRDGIKE